MNNDRMQEDALNDNPMLSDPMNDTLMTDEERSFADEEFVQGSEAEEYASEEDAELSGLQNEAATLADSELEDEENLPREGETVSLERAMQHSRSERGDAGYDSAD